MRSKTANTLSLLRSILVLDWLIWAYTIVLGALSLLSSLFDRDGSIQHGFARLWSRLILATAMSPVTVRGLERIDPRKAAVYAVNHGSALDIPVLYANLPFQFRILAKKELFRYPFMGWHLKRSGQIAIEFVDEEPAKSARGAGEAGADAGQAVAGAPSTQRARGTIEALKRAVHTLQSGMPLVIFPEGGRSKDGHIQPFLGGAFWAAIRAGVDVVPVAIVGAYEALPMNSFHIRPRRIEMVIGDPIPTAGYARHDMKKLTAEVRSVVARLYYERASVAPQAQDGRREVSQTLPG